MIDVLFGFTALVIIPGSIATVMDVAHYYDPSDRLIRSVVWGFAGLVAILTLSGCGEHASHAFVELLR